MATAKIMFTEDPAKLEKYLQDKLEKDDLLTEHFCSLETMKEDFVQVQDEFRTKGNLSIHIIHSFSPDESKQAGADKIHSLGVELASRFAPGHQYVVETHTDKKHYHNHIVINPVSYEDGKRIRNKKLHLERLRDISDELSLEHGLSVLPKQERTRTQGITERARMIETARGRSYLVDLCEKIRFSSKHAKDLGQFNEILNVWDIKTKRRGNTLTYIYPGYERGKRASKLGPEFDIKSLNQCFNDNVSKGTTLHLCDASKAFENSRITGDVLSKLNKAKTKSIIDYCERNEIGLVKNQSGQHHLIDKPNIEVTAFAWFNTDTGTRGNIIDFVAKHKHFDFEKAANIIISVSNQDYADRLLRQRHSKQRCDSNTIEDLADVIPAGPKASRKSNPEYQSKTALKDPLHFLNYERTRRLRALHRNTVSKELDKDKNDPFSLDISQSWDL